MVLCLANFDRSSPWIDFKFRFYVRATCTSNYQTYFTARVILKTCRRKITFDPLPQIDENMLRLIVTRHILHPDLR